MMKYEKPIGLNTAPCWLCPGEWGGFLDRNLALEFVRVTEAAAIAASQWFGRGEKKKADGAAVKEMRARFNQIDFNGIVVIGEGEKDEAPMLFTDEKLGTGDGPEFDIAVDPLECTSNCANGRPNSISVLAAGPKGSLLKVPGTYMDQLAVGPDAKGVIDISQPPSWNLPRIAEALGKPVEDLVVAILDRDRHKELISQVREAGARVFLIDHGTVGAGIATAQPESGIDVMWGIGGAPEAIITAAGLKCYGGDVQATLNPHKPAVAEEAKEMGLDLDKVYRIDDLAAGDNLVFAATGISNGPLLKGVVLTPWGALTHSIVMRSKSGTIRYLETHHHESISKREE
jgi:fructose-1,6-bisphosphatase class II